MRISGFLFLVVLSPVLGGALSGCTQSRPLIDAQEPGPEPVSVSLSVPPVFSLLDLGRRLSEGGVDILDPWVPTLTIPAGPEKLQGIQFDIPKHESMIIRDSSVTVYSLEGFGKAVSGDPAEDRRDLSDPPLMDPHFFQKSAPIEQEVLPP